MKRIIINIIAAVLLTLLGIVWVNGDLLAQTNTGPQTVQEQLRAMNIEIPFIDKDGDGINDLMQNGWGLRFMEQYKNRRALWNQMMEGEEKEKQMIDTDGDGIPDTPLNEMFRQQLRGKIDTDGDGVPDTQWEEHMRRRFQFFDQDGDGVPDELTPEQIRQHFQEMKEWREQIRQNLMNGLPAFTDENGDAVPDNLPGGGFGWMKRRKGGR